MVRYHQQHAHGILGASHYGEQVAETNLQGDNLAGHLAECVANCVTLRDQYIPTAQLRGYVVDSAMLKPRPEGDVLLKYEAAAERSLNNALKEYKALAKLELDLAYELDDTDAQTAPTPEPTPAEPPTPAKPELVPPAPVETNKPNLDITLIKPEPYKNPLSDEDRNQTSVKLEFTSKGTYTAYCEAMLEKAAAKSKSQRLTTHHSPKVTQPAATARRSTAIAMVAPGRLATDVAGKKSV